MAGGRRASPDAAGAGAGGVEAAGTRRARVWAVAGAWAATKSSAAASDRAANSLMAWELLG
ncbi:MAG: hypothetical protein LC800_21435 [Acidobacteria bacterium]|nr:hypothetical protein [Acidobacteriota bacterium]